MTNTRKYLITAGLGTALAVLSAGPAFALDCDAPVHHTPSAPAHSGLPGGLPGGGGGTVCINEGGAYANGIVANSPGVLSGNQIQIPINIQTNICGNSLSIL
ncbi:chaplin [Kitasatospora purpeofusca]|uniref:chaplin n=1 Tax=Kitasatospora purpeofusca TaxID=67352 RepID=UPI00225A02BE|nr:chaplin [Kitasatospora purpeofusca]MCX4755960.1 chaplin [Kitasatospora purpeofusca]WSR36191.1 chaplin [Kitasatospora purpeofusca]